MTRCVALCLVALLCWGAIVGCTTGPVAAGTSWRGSTRHREVVVDVVETIERRRGHSVDLIGQHVEQAFYTCGCGCVVAWERDRR